MFSISAASTNAPPMAVARLNASPKNIHTQNGPRITSTWLSNVAVAAGTTRVPKVYKIIPPAKVTTPINSARPISLGGGVKS